MEHGAVYRQGLLFITILTLAVIIVDFIILELSTIDCYTRGDFGIFACCVFWRRNVI